jgi:hypothetical protein
MVRIPIFMLKLVFIETNYLKLLMIVSTLNSEVN